MRILRERYGSETLTPKTCEIRKTAKARAVKARVIFADFLKLLKSRNIIKQIKAKALIIAAAL